MNRKKYKLTEWEEEVLKRLAEGPMNTLEIIDWHYKQSEMELNSHQVIHSRMSRLTRKLALNGDPRIINKTQRKGPRPIVYQLGRRTA